MCTASTSYTRVVHVVYASASWLSICYSACYVFYIHVHVLQVHACTSVLMQGIEVISCIMFLV